MGKELTTHVRYGGEEGTAKVLLETNELKVTKSALRGAVSLTDTARKRARLDEGWLLVGDYAIELGAAGAAWLAAIRSPKSVVQKLGVKAGVSVLIKGAVPKPLVTQLEQAGATLIKRAAPSAWLMVAINDERQLASLPLPGPAGALWLLRPKGPLSRVREAATRAAARSRGLVDVKVVAISSTHSAEKYVWPKR